MSQSANFSVLSKSKLSDDTAQKLLANVFDACEREHNVIPLKKLQTYCEYRRERYTFQKTLLMIILVIFAMLPLCFICPSFTITDITQKGQKQPVYQINVTGGLPVSLVAASIDGHALHVTETGDRVFEVEPTQNGTMKVKVSLANRQYAVGELEITNVDLDRPELISQEKVGDELHLYVKDEGLGVDWDGIEGITITGAVIKPLSYDKDNGLVIFEFPKGDLNIYIPDLKGNTLQILLTQQRS